VLRHFLIVGMTLALVVILTGSGFLVGTASAQSGTPIESCQTIDSSGTYYLAADNITTSAASCIDIVADGVTFNGNQNVIKDGGYSTTAVSASADNVAVTNLRTRAVGTAVQFNGVVDGRIENIAVEDDSGGVGVASTSGTAIVVSGGSNNVIRDNFVSDPGDSAGGHGISIESSTGNLVVSNEISAPYSAGIKLYKANDNNVTQNSIDGAGLGSRYSNVGILIGEFTAGASDGNRILDNEINGNGFGGNFPELEDGIVVRNGTGNELDTNSVRDAANRGITVGDDDTIVIDNAVNNVGSTGIIIAASSTNLTDNTVRYAGVADGGAGVRDEGSNTRIVANTIGSGDGIGLYVNDVSAAPTVENNTIQYNDDYAITVESSPLLYANRTRLGTGASWVSVSGSDFSIDGGSKPATLPTRRQAIGIYFTVNTGSASLGEFKLKYPDSAVTTINESTLRVWQYDGSWTRPADNNTVDTTDNVVSADGLAGGTVAPLANNTPPAADATASAVSLALNESVTFDASESEDIDGKIVEYRWDFDGDGTDDRTTSSSSTTYEYARTGEFDPSVTVVDDGDDTNTTALSVSVRDQPIAALSVSPSPTSIDANTTFNASNSTFANGTITEYRWDFGGDGTVETTTDGPVVNYTYPSTGEYAPAVTAVGDNGNNSTASVSLTVRENLAPRRSDSNAGLTYICTRGFSGTICVNWVGDDVPFSTQGFTDLDGEIVEYRWDFDGDDVIEETTSTGSASYTFESTGSYDATVTLVDDDGGTISDTTDVSILERKTGSIAGNVTNATSGGPIDNATVIVYREDIQENGSRTDGNGTYAFNGLAADDATYNVTIDPAGYEASFQEVTVDENTTTTVDFALQPTETDPGAGNVLVTVENESGSVLSGASVEFRNGTGTVATGTTDQYGQVFASVPATHQSVVIEKPGYALTTAAVSVDENGTSYVSAIMERPTTSYFDVSISSTNEPITEGETLTVDAVVENVGKSAGTQTVLLSVGGVERDTNTVTLDATNGTSLTLQWATTSGDAGPYTARVESANDSSPAPVVIDAESSGGGGGGGTETVTETATDTTTETEDGTTTTDSTTTAAESITATPTETTSSQAPGFGLLTAIVSLLGLWLLARWQRIR
jgi:parallel beta-helix repeat protein